MNNRINLAVKGIIKLLSGIVAMGILLFIPAGSMSYPGAWRLIGVMFVSMLVLGGFLLIKSPELLAKRLGSKEGENEQKLVIAFSAIMFILSFILCGLDYRFGWSKVPAWLIIISGLVFFATYLGFAELLRENEYLSRTVEVQDNQKVISTGLYGIVRHPMYFIVFFMFISMPLIIGSFIGLIPLVAFPIILAKRIENEEKVLEEGLEGYKEYMVKVRYRLIPYIW